jgi:hypothetical protein
MYTYAFVCDHATASPLHACMSATTRTLAWPLMHVNTQQRAQRVVFPRSQSMAACKCLLTWDVNHLSVVWGYELLAVKGAQRQSCGIDPRAGAVIIR